jgi:hypothetical protein
VEDPERKGFVPDRAIVEGIRAGREDAQRLLLDKYWPWLVVTARHTGLSEQDAEEVVSDVFFRMLQPSKPAAREKISVHYCGVQRAMLPFRTTDKAAKDASTKPRP